MPTCCNFKTSIFPFIFSFAIFDFKTNKPSKSGKKSIVIDTFVIVKKNACAIGKQVRDIFWPANLFILSIKHDESRKAEVDEHGGKAIHEGDILHVRYSTYNEEETKEELMAIVGIQDYNEKDAVEI